MILFFRTLIVFCKLEFPSFAKYFSSPGWGFFSVINGYFYYDIDTSEGLIFHSDRGSQYAAYADQDKLETSGIRQSMGAKGDCYDNSSMGSFFATLKKELTHRRRFRSRAEARLAIIDYIETWYNSRRPHSSLGYLSPIEFEKAQSSSQAA